MCQFSPSGPGMTSRTDPRLDATDRAIGEQLQHDGRAPFTRIAAELGLTGALKFAEPFLNKTFGAMADKAVEGLAAWLSAGTTT